MTQRRIAVHLVGSGPRQMTSDELEEVVRDARSQELPGVEIRCPKPRHRWKPGTDGPCGRVLGRLYQTQVGAAIEILAPVKLVGDRADAPPWRWEILAEPSTGRFVERPNINGVQADVMIRDPRSGFMGTGGEDITFEIGQAPDIHLRCPRCGVWSDLPTLTGRRLLK